MPESELAIAGRIGALESWARTEDRTARTEPGRRAFDQRFLDQVDPERVLDPAERARRADFARRAYFQRLALKSAQARRLRRTGGDDPKEAA